MVQEWWLEGRTYYQLSGMQLITPSSQSVARRLTPDHVILPDSVPPHTGCQQLFTRKKNVNTALKTYNKHILVRLFLNAKGKKEPQ